MEFDIDLLRRDWIEGISGDAFNARLESCQDRLAALTEEQKSQGAIICEDDPVDFAAAFFATLSMKVPVILANPKWGEREWMEFDSLVYPAIAFGQVGVPPLGGQLDAASRLKAGLQPCSILIPTGGTTGGVKLAVHNWASLVAASEGVQKFLRGGPINSCCLLPLYHVSGLMQLVRSFVSCGRIRFDDAEVEGDCLSLVPTQLLRALQSETSIQKLNTAHAIFVGGGPMSRELAQKVRDLKLPVIPVYGMTETAAMCAAVPADDFLVDLSAGAVPIGDTQFSINSDGRIRIQSSGLFQGYYGRAPLDLSEGYMTDDLGHLDASGRLHVEGRADRIIITGGEKVDPAEVEAALCTIPEIEAALVLGLPHKEWGQQVVAFIQNKRAAVDLDALRGRLREQLASYKIPKQVYTLAQLPLDEKGKVDQVAVSRLIN